MRGALAAIVLTGLMWGGDARADAPCRRCGRCWTDAICCPVVETKKDKLKCWECKCEEFCIPGMSKWDCCRWIPGCGSVQVRKELVRTEKTVEVPDYKWEVKHLCPDCRAEGPAPAPADAPQPIPAEPQPAPQPEANPAPAGPAAPVAFISDGDEPAAPARGSLRALFPAVKPAPQTAPAAPRKATVWRPTSIRPLSEMFFQRAGAVASDDE